MFSPCPRLPAKAISPATSPVISPELNVGLKYTAFTFEIFILCNPPSVIAAQQIP